MLVLIFALSFTHYHLEIDSGLCSEPFTLHPILPQYPMACAVCPSYGRNQVFNVFLGTKLHSLLYL